MAQVPAQVRENLKNTLEKMRGQIAEILPKHVTAERMMKTAMVAANSNPALYSCDMSTVAQSIMIASSLGLDCGGALGSAYLVPYGKQCQLIVGYRGLIDLARRSGQIVSIEAHVVYENDEFSFEWGLNADLKHRPTMKGERGEIIATYAVAHLQGGGVQFEVMTEEDIAAVKKHSQTGRKNVGPWKDHPAAMRKKSAIRQLAKYLPLTTELREAIEVEETPEVTRFADILEINDEEDEPKTKTARVAEAIPSE